MILYFLKSLIILSICLGIYKLFLEREKMNRFNRFFLLGSLVFGLWVPSFNLWVPILIHDLPTAPAAIYNPVVQTRFDIQKSLQDQAQSITNSMEQTIVTASGLSIPNLTPNYTQPDKGYARNKIMLNVLMVIYLVGFAVFLTRFIYGLFGIIHQLKQGEKISYQTKKLILLPEHVTPHSFLNYIFLSKKDYENEEVSEVVLKHEQSHLTQFHTLDILFIECAHMLFWFNPLIPFYKRAIKENHEFLADEAVLNETQDLNGYQDTLLASVSDVHSTPLASTLTYRLTKKRLVMMIKESSRMMMNTKRASTIIALLGVFVIFCESAPINLKSVLGENYEVFRSTAESNTYSDITLHTEKNHERGPYKARYVVDENGALYSGEQNWYYKRSDDPSYTHKFENGLRTSTYYYNLDGKVARETFYTYEGNEEIKREQVLSGFDSRMRRTISERKDGLHYLKMYHENGQVSFESVEREQPDRRPGIILYHGLITSYDENGNILGQERWENGVFLEKLK